MSLIPVPGYGSTYVVDTNSGDIYRVGSQGGLHNPLTNERDSGANYTAVGGQVGTNAQTALQNYNGAGQGGGGSEMSEEEAALLGLQMESIQSSLEIQKKVFEREEARREAYNRWVTGERWDPTTQEERQGQLAAKADKISSIEQDRLEKALNGELPVSPSTEREITDNRAVLEERLRRNLGTGYETSEAGGKELALADESASILREADRKGYIERGIQPSINAAQFAQQAIGQYIPGETPGLTSALRGLQQTRVQEDQNQLYKQQLEAKQAADFINSKKKSSDSGFFSSGFGKVLGALLGGGGAYAANYFGQSKSGGGGGGASNIYGQGQGFS